MRVLLLGDRRGLNENRWKDDLAEAGVRLGWDVEHVNARDIDQPEVVRQARGRDMLLWARTHGHEPPGTDLAAMLRRVEDAGVTTVSLHLDLYWTIANRQPQIGVHPFWAAQHVFTGDGAARDWAGRGVNHHWCPPAMGHRFFGYGTPDPVFAHRAVFVGSCSKRVHGQHRIRLLRWATARWGTGFARYGGRGEPRVWGSDLSDLYASAGVVLGDSASQAYGWSDRLPVTLGRGGLLAFPRVAGMAEQGFTDNVLITYDRFDFATIARRLDALDQTARRAMTDAALTLVEERHMWTHRLEMIARTVGLG